jgi:hypothetical protein
VTDDLYGMGINAGLDRADKEICEMPAADVVSKGVYEQVQWERDMAMQQLEEHGIPFCGKADDVVEVVRCKDCGWSRMVNVNGKQEYYCQCWNPGNVIHVDARGFCMWGERKEQT